MCPCRAAGNEKPRGPLRAGRVTRSCTARDRPRSAAYLNRGPCQAQGGEWLLSVEGWSAPWMPGLIWVRDSVRVGDVMVDGSFRWSDSGRSVFGGPPPWGGSRGTCGSRPVAWRSSSMVGRHGGQANGWGLRLRRPRRVPARRVRARGARGRSGARACARWRVLVWDGRHGSRWLNWAVR